MRYIEAFSSVHESGYIKGRPEVSLFLAGGITGCPRWQDKVVKLLTSSQIVIMNPRREVWPGDDDKDEIRKQILWERDHLKFARAILFWFCKETNCPITLFELGKWIGINNKRIFVGCEPGYSRTFDVTTQLAVEGFKIPVHDNLESLIAEVKGWAHGCL